MLAFYLVMPSLKKVNLPNVTGCPLVLLENSLRLFLRCPMVAVSGYGGRTGGGGGDGGGTGGL